MHEKKRITCMHEQVLNPSRQRSIDIVFGGALSRNTRWKLSGKYLALVQATQTLRKGNCERLTQRLPLSVRFPANF